jgi:GH24 family phage-related lysozyme (muramidase)
MTITSDRYLYRLKYRDICKKIPFKNFTMNTLFYHVFSKYSLLIVTLLSFFAGSSQTYNMATGTVTTCSGNFYDNGGAAGNFTNGQNITETFISGNGDRLKFDFTSMSNLNAASLTIYDGPTAAYPVIAIPATGTFSIESTGSSLTFQFYSPSGSFTTYAGWEANITCTTPTLTPYTMSAGTATACSGVFFDPAGPAANYVNSNITTQTFSSGSSDFINFTFTNFDVAIGDTLFAYDGTNVSAPLIGKYTGIRLPEVISSRTGSSMTFRFATNNTTVASGWKAMIACSVSPVVPTVFNMQDGVRSVCSGTFYDNGGASGNFTNGQNIIETFTSISGSRLKFDFTSMSSLNAASLTIYDGPTAAYPVISTPASGTFSVESTGSSLTFQFYSQSGSFTTYAGWEANISCTTPTLTPYTMSAGTVTTCSGVFFDPAGPATNFALLILTDGFCLTCATLYSDRHKEMTKNNVFIGLVFNLPFCCRIHPWQGLHFGKDVSQMLRMNAFAATGVHKYILRLCECSPLQKIVHVRFPFGFHHVHVHADAFFDQQLIHLIHFKQFSRIGPKRVHCCLCTVVAILGAIAEALYPRCRMAQVIGHFLDRFLSNPG